VPDVFGAIPRGTLHGHFIELKRADAKPKRASSKGPVTESQRDFHDILRDMRYRVDVAYGGVEAGQYVQAYLGLVNDKAKNT